LICRKSIVSPKPGVWNRSRAYAHSTGISVSLLRFALKCPWYTGSKRARVVKRRTSASVIVSPTRNRRRSRRSLSQSSAVKRRSYAAS
jgi:hypothetical protein